MTNFALWLAAKLEAAGYRVFADVISLRTGDSWRQRLTECDGDDRRQAIHHSPAASAAMCPFSLARGIVTRLPVEVLA